MRYQYAASELGVWKFQLASQVRSVQRQMAYWVASIASFVLSGAVNGRGGVAAAEASSS